MELPNINLVIISGSQRLQSQSAKVAKYIASAATEYQEVNHIELCRYNQPFWDGEETSKFENVSSWPLISHKIRKADALVLITPEWGGMADVGAND